MREWLALRGPHAAEEAMPIGQQNIQWATQSITQKIDDAIRPSTVSECRVPLAISALAEAVLLLAAVLREKS